MASTPLRRALLYGIIGFLVVAVPVVVWAIRVMAGPQSPEMPGLIGRVFGMLAIGAGVIVAFIVGAISAAIGGRIDREARKRE